MRITDLFKKSHEEILKAVEQFGWDDIIETIEIEVGKFAERNSKIGEHLETINTLIKLYDLGYGYAIEHRKQLDIDGGLCFEIRNFALQTLLKIMNIVREQSKLGVVNIPYDYMSEEGQKQIAEYLGEPVFETLGEKWLENNLIRTSIDFAKSRQAHYILNGVIDFEFDKSYKKIAELEYLTIYTLEE